MCDGIECWSGWICYNIILCLAYCKDSRVQKYIRHEENERAIR